MSLLVSSPGLTRPPEIERHPEKASRGTATGQGPSQDLPRAQVAGKFFTAGGEKLYVRGVTYGPFGPDGSDHEYGNAASARRDFSAMAAAGVNAVRVYTVPPRWLLDLAAAEGLRVMVGLPWEQHVAFLDDAARAGDVERRVRRGVSACAGHPAVLAYAVGNEIPAPVVRWYGHRRVERFVRRLYDAVKETDPAALATYVNYPSTEYLDLPFLDFAAFNVYLESRQDLESYVARLHNVAGDRPLLMAEVGLDSLRNGEWAQARALRRQVRAVFRGGCAGVFLFSWTDAWHRGGLDIEDWHFGLTTRDRRPKPALAAVARAFDRVPAAEELPWPGVSVIVCSHNGSRTIGECLDGLARLQYPRYEVLVVDDGSTDGTAEVVREHSQVRLIRTPNQGLSNARNTGMRAARHEVVAYIDDDAVPDPQWLTYLAESLMRGDQAGAGGPNVPPGDCGAVADAVAMAPGGPVHVLLTDRVAEHIPGCNMAFRKDRLEAIGGFDPQFRIAGDDVDVCWRLQERGWTLGFNPAAMVWHRRRDTVRRYWKQQVNYGRAEADLERKWPEKYNAAGHLTWAGRLYGNGLLQAMGWWKRRRIYHGTWGSALFQSVYHVRPSWLWSLPAMPEWYVLVLVLTGVSLLGAAWEPLRAAIPLLLFAVAAPLAQAARAAHRALEARPAVKGCRRAGLLALTTWLHLLQPAARLYGRFTRGLTPWRRRGVSEAVWPLPRIVTQWAEAWSPHEGRLHALEADLRKRGAVVVRGGDFDRWDCEVRGGVLGAARVRLLVEEHGRGRQLARFRVWPHASMRTVLAVTVQSCLAGLAAADGAWLAAAVIGAAAVGAAARAMYECGAAVATVISTLARDEISTKPADVLAATPEAVNADDLDEVTLAGG